MSSDSHATKVANIAKQAASLSQSKQPVHIDKGGVHHVVPVAGDSRFGTRRLDASSLNEIIQIDVEHKRCTAEAGVTFSDLVDATLEHGLVPVVVPELRGITIGGAVSGCSLESTSHRYGGFHDTCLEYEIVTGDGRVLTCSREQDPLIFEMVHGSYGTLAILTQLTFQLMPAKPYVRMEYRAFASAAAALAEFRERIDRRDFEFIDAIAHGPENYVVCLGSMSSSAPYANAYGVQGPYYKSTKKKTEDYIPIRDYFFRYDDDAHWLSRTVRPLEWKPVRAGLGRYFLGSENLIRWSKRLEKVFHLKKRPDVVVDVFIPARNFVEFCEWYENELGFFPLWAVPYRIPKPYPWVSPQQADRLGEELMIDCAVYGMKNNRKNVDVSELLEEKTFELGGVKTLISRNHYSRERFWDIYNESNYYAVKEKTDPEGLFADLFEKLHRVG
jgi:FAD/FMN-containing dehydrogenase